MAAPLPELINQFLEYLEIEKNCSKLTIRDYKHYLQIFHDWYTATQKGKSIESLDLGTVRKYRVFLSNKPTQKNEQLKKVTQNYYVIALLSTAIFGTVFGLIFLKKALILKRMFATPTKALTILLAQGTSRLIVALLQTILILLIAVVVFKFYLPHGWLTFFDLILLSAFGLVAFLGFGYLIAGLSNDENTASPLTNLITLPQFLLSGTFFPTENLPTWLQPVANNLPLSYFNIAVRKVTTEGDSLIATWPYLLGLLAWGLVMYLLAARTFKWQ